MDAVSVTSDTERNFPPLPTSALRPRHTDPPKYQACFPLRAFCLPFPLPGDLRYCRTHSPTSTGSLPGQTSPTALCEADLCLSPSSFSCFFLSNTQRCWILSSIFVSLFYYPHRHYTGSSRRAGGFHPVGST